MEIFETPSYRDGRSAGTPQTGRLMFDHGASEDLRGFQNLSVCKNLGDPKTSEVSKTGPKTSVSAKTSEVCPKPG